MPCTGKSFSLCWWSVCLRVSGNVFNAVAGSLQHYISLHFLLVQSFMVTRGENYTQPCKRPSKYPEIVHNPSKSPVDILFSSFSFYVFWLASHLSQLLLLPQVANIKQLLLIVFEQWLKGKRFFCWMSSESGEIKMNLGSGGFQGSAW